MQNNRRRFLGATTSALAGAPLVAAAATTVAHAAIPHQHDRITRGLVDCQSHLFFPEVIEVMRQRKTEPLVFDQNGVAMLKMGDWLRKIPTDYTSVDVKLAAMDSSGIEITLLSTNDPGPEWFGATSLSSTGSMLARRSSGFRSCFILPSR